MADLFHLTELDFSPIIRADGADVRLTVHSLPRLLLAGGRLPEQFSIGSSHHFGLATDCIAILSPESSSWSVCCDGAERMIGPGDLTILDLLQSSSWSIQSKDAGSRQFTAAIFARSRILPAFSDEARIHGHVCPNMTWVANGCRANFRWLFSHPGFSSGRDAADASEAVASYVARALRSSVLAGDDSRALGPTGLLPRIIRFVQAHLGSPSLNAEIIEGQFGVSRAALYRLFQPFGGVSAFIRERRLLRARGILEDRAYANEPIGTIARSCGFASISSFNRAFGDRFGVSPRIVRQKACSSAVGATRGCELQSFLNQLT